MKATRPSPTRLLYEQFARFGFGIKLWDDLSHSTKRDWEARLLRLMRDVAESEKPAVEVFYRAFSGKGNPPYEFSDANPLLKAEWHDRVRYFLESIATTGGD